MAYRIWFMVCPVLEQVAELLLDKANLSLLAQHEVVTNNLLLLRLLRAL